MQSELTERAKTAWNSIADEFNQWDALGLDEQETYVALTAALSDKQAAEVKALDIIDRSHTIVDDVLDMALYLRDCPRENIWQYQDAANRLAAFMNEVRSALVDVPAVESEPVAWLGRDKLYRDRLFSDRQIAQSWLEDSDGVERRLVPLYASRLREGEDSAEVDNLAAVLWRTEAEDAGAPASIAAGRTRPAFDEQSDNTKARWRKFARAALAATRSGSATTSSGGEHE